MTPFISTLIEETFIIQPCGMPSLVGIRIFHLFCLFGCFRNKSFITTCKSHLLYLYMNKSEFSFTISTELILLIALYIDKISCLSLLLVSILMEAFCYTLILLLSTQCLKFPILINIVSHSGLVVSRHGLYAGSPGFNSHCCHYQDCGWWRCWACLLKSLTWSTIPRCKIGTSQMLGGEL